MTFGWIILNKICQYYEDEEKESPWSGTWMGTSRGLQSGTLEGTSNSTWKGIVVKLRSRSGLVQVWFSLFTAKIYFFGA